MKDFNNYNCLFIHIPKTGGNSVRRGIFHDNWIGHNSIIKERTFWPHKRYLSLFKFAFVRNPWDRLYSAYTYLRYGGDRRDQADIDFFTGLNPKVTASFEAFTLDYINLPCHSIYQHFIPQHNFITVHKKIAIDFIGRYECFPSDYSSIQRHLGLPPSPPPHANATHHKPFQDYREAYTPRMIDAVALLYATDIELFDYTFE